MKRRRITATVTLTFMAVAATAVAQNYAVDWHTIDGGGRTFSTGGAYSLGGTIGQPDAGPGSAGMSGGSFELVGGFWPVTLVCHCPGDMNGDGLLDGRDVQKFVECLMIPPPAGCNCADVDRANGVNLDDIVEFVADLLSAAGCP